METAKQTMRNVAGQFMKFVLVVLATIIVFAVLYHFAEGYAFYQCIEWAVQTITTVGYGNYSAQTVAGSLLSSILMLWGAFVLAALVTAIVVNELRVDPDNFSDAEQKQIMNDLLEIKRMLKERE